MVSVLVLDGSLIDGAAPTPDVPWWSFTKTVLAAVALSLVRDGLVTLDDTLPRATFTLRQLLRHEAGLADYGDLAEYHLSVSRNEPPWPEEDMLRRLEAEKLRYEPGNGWSYSNVGYLYVARLIERLTDSTLAEALADRAFVPLGLKSPRLAETSSALRGDAIGLSPGYDPGWVFHGLLIGSLSDAALFLDRLMSQRLLPRSLLNEMRAQRTLGERMLGRPWTVPGYGLGLMAGTMQGDLEVYGHTGMGPRSVVAIYHCRRAGVSSTCGVLLEGFD